MRVRNFNELRAKLPSEIRAKNEAWVRKTVAELPLVELRAARELTQQNLAEVLGVNQAAVSKLERRTDMYVSTLARFIEAMGGKLEIRAVFPDGAVTLERFSEPKRPRTAHTSDSESTRG
ncbi:MAG TPA: XRE family transcriptional regulator [Bryobacteraceae bacterium]|jgi:DNA-binding XRE family transcriptional regulator